ncbi:hypothetical protein ACT3CE_02095 [Marinifilum sp. RC60d5]|uniref:hypothetical protein n=1 Tax=Marinifilum sp. RC60d5 TaxID=3458414 RepID=UPI0040359FDD
MMKILGLIIGVCLFSTVFGQGRTAEERFLLDINSFSSEVRISQLEHLNNLKVNYDGSPFFTENWETGKVIFTNEQSVDYKLHYNIYTQEFWIKNDKNEIRKLKQTKDISRITILNSNFKFINYYEDNKPKSSIMESLVDKPVGLLKMYHCKLIPGDKNVNTYSGPTKSRFSKKTDYYYIENENIKLLPTKKKEFLEYFRNDQQKITRYIKQHKLKLKKEKDLIKIFEFYNQK